MELREYPDAIAEAELHCLSAQQLVRDLSRALEARKAEFGAMVANDEVLSNDAKRKAARAELELTDSEYLDLKDRLEAAQFVAHEARIEAERMANLFRVERLLTEERIASKNAG